MDVFGFTCGPLYENSYLAILENGHAILVDPGFSTDHEWSQCKRVLADSNASLSAILLTHAHLDHVLGIPTVIADFPDLPVYMGDQFPEMWQSIPDQPAMFGVDFPVHPMPVEPTRLAHGATCDVDGISFEVRSTPGHSPDHVVFVAHHEGVVFAGDVLFKGSVGRTDIPFGDGHLLKDSIETQLYTLPSAFAVYPGHGELTTLGTEKTSNPFVRAR
ncbi:MAG: MBL fold metallo-hydrolase [Balneolaceae bacterium]|nr:MBL fold metallo-hydrolase [Balneolaceae bacterium]